MPQASGDLVGTPYWDTVNETTAHVDANGDGDQADTDVRVVYLATSLGHIIKLIDTGSGLSQPASGPWSSDFTSPGVTTIASPLTCDGTNLYFGGRDGLNAANVFAVQIAGGGNEKTLQRTVPSVNLVSTTPSWSAYGGTTYVFVGSAASSGQAYAYRVNMTSGDVRGSFTGATANVNGGAVLVDGRAYFVTDGGTLHALDAFNFNTGGFIDVTGFPYQSTSAKPIKSAPWIDARTYYAYFGDDGGSVYALTDAGAIMSGYPLSISGTITVTSTPLYRQHGGVIAVGASDGYAYFIDRQNNSHVPVVFKRFFVTSSGSVSNVAYNSSGSSFMVSSSDGKLVFVNAADVTDPTPSVE